MVRESVSKMMYEALAVEEDHLPKEKNEEIEKDFFLMRNWSKRLGETLFLIELCIFS